MGPESEAVIEMVSHQTHQGSCLQDCGPQLEMEMRRALLSAVQRAVLGFGPQLGVQSPPPPGAGFLSGSGAAGLDFHRIPFEAAQVQPELVVAMAVPALPRVSGLSGVAQALLSSQLHPPLLKPPCQ